MNGDPLCEGFDELLQKRGCSLVGNFAIGSKELVGAANIGLRLLHCGHIEENQRGQEGYTAASA